MRKAVIPFVLSVGLIAIWAAPADAASTRAEYIAQADPVCQSFLGPVNNAKTSYNTNYKRWVRDLSKGTLHNWVRQTARTAISLRRLSHVEASLTEQLTAVPPLATDAGVISTWLNGRRQAETSAYSAATAFGLFKFDQFRKKLRQADAANAAGIRAISGFGFQVCGVSI